MFDLFKNLMFSAKDSSMLNNKMSNPGDTRNFSHASRYLSEVGAAKIAAVFAAVSFFAVGAKGLLDFFAPNPQNNGVRNGGGQRRDHGRR